MHEHIKGLEVAEDGNGGGGLGGHGVEQLAKDPVHAGHGHPVLRGWVVPVGGAGDGDPISLARLGQVARGGACFLDGEGACKGDFSCDHSVNHANAYSVIKVKINEQF